MNTFSGIVQKGEGRGKALGFPTINIPLIDGQAPGVYVAQVYIQGESPYMAAAFADTKRNILEAHLLDFSDDLYGLEVRIELCKKLREWIPFENDEHGRQQIGADIAQARRYFQRM